MRVARRGLILTVLLSLLVLPSASGPQSRQDAGALAGQSSTLLPNGRWLLIGGQGPTGSLGTAAVRDPDTGV